MPSPDEQITRNVLEGNYPGEAAPELIVCVADATNLRLHLRFVLEVKRLGRPVVLALNMMDTARRRGIHIDVEQLQRRLGLPVVETIAVKRGGARALIERVDSEVPVAAPAQPDDAESRASCMRKCVRSSTLRCICRARRQRSTTRSIAGRCILCLAWRFSPS
jgi:ferrous iron transport protein B